MKIEAWWFNNRQKESEILQPEFFTPQTHYGVYAEIDKIEFPFTITVYTYFKLVEIYHQEFIIKSERELNNLYEIECNKNIIIFKGYVSGVFDSPDKMIITILACDKKYVKTIHCEYARLFGKITDFDNVTFPAAILFYRIAFGGVNTCLGVWSDKNGEYSVIIPKGIYNAFYVDDESYGKTSLENWSWHMIVDKDEEHNFKIGNGEVYSLSIWPNNGGSSTLFIYFRPMVLPSIKSKEYEIEINGQRRNVIDISPELELGDIRITLNEIELEIISIQKIYETAKSYIMPAYIIQTVRCAENINFIGKQTLIVEYNTKNRIKKMDYFAQSQGRIQFFYKDACALTLI